MDDFNLIAKILSAGKEGFVKIQLFPGFYIAQDLIKYLYLEFWGKKKKFELEEVLIIKNSTFLKFKNFDNERDISLLIDREIFVHKNNLIKVRDSKYSSDNIVGCRVYKGKDLLGSVIDFFETPANSVIEILKENGTKILIPFVHSVFEKIDPENYALLLNPDFGIDDDED